MPEPLSPYQLWSYRSLLELRVRKTGGTAFQDFFSTIAERLHGADFVRVRAMGSHGDKGCDGYLASSGIVYQCYGKMGDTALNTRTLVTKVQDDYALAAGHLQDIMKEWHFVHNLADGVPTEFVQEIEAMKVAHAPRAIGHMGPTALWTMVRELDEHDLIDLLGPAASAEDSAHLNLEAVATLVRGLIAEIDAAPFIGGSIDTVPVDKLEFNGLPTYWRGLIAAGSQNVVYLEDFLARLPNPLTGTTIARAFSDRYRAARAEGLSPNGIMSTLYEQVTGIGAVPAEQQVAAHALLAWLFKSCDIFEDRPPAVPA